MQSSEPKESSREVVVPGELLGGPGTKAGPGTFTDAGKVYAAQLGIKSVRANSVSVVPLGGRYVPVRGDLVIGTIVDIGPSNWLVDINAPHPSPLHVTEVPWRVEFGETRKFMNVGDVVLLEIAGVDEVQRIQVSMKDRGLRKLTGGLVIEISPSKVPRVVGKNGSMIQMLKNMTGCRIYVGQNGRIWIDGDLQDVVRAAEAINIIEEEAHSLGLTERVKRFLEGSSRGKEGA